MRFRLILLIKSTLLVGCISDRASHSLETTHNVTPAIHIEALELDPSSEILSDNPFARNFHREVTRTLGSYHGALILTQISKALSDNDDTLYRVSGSIKEVGTSSLDLKLQMRQAEEARVIWQQEYRLRREELFDYASVVSSDLALHLSLKSNPISSFDVEASEKSKPSRSAYQLMLSAEKLLAQPSIENVSEAQDILDQCLGLEEQYALAYAMKSMCHSMLREMGKTEKEHLIPAGESVGLAYRFDRHLPEAYLAHAMMNRSFDLADPEENSELCEHALQLQGSYHSAWFMSGLTKLELQDTAGAVEQIQKALLLAPHILSYQEQLNKL